MAGLIPASAGARRIPNVIRAAACRALHLAAANAVAAEHTAEVSHVLRVSRQGAYSSPHLLTSLSRPRALPTHKTRLKTAYPPSCALSSQRLLTLATRCMQQDSLCPRQDSGERHSLGCSSVVIPLRTRLLLGSPLAARHPCVVPQAQCLHLRHRLHRNWWTETE